MRWWCKSPKPGQSKTWVLFGRNHGKLGRNTLPVGGARQEAVPWRLPEGNPYLDGDETRIRAYRSDVAFASHLNGGRMRWRHVRRRTKPLTLLGGSAFSWRSSLMVLPDTSGWRASSSMETTFVLMHWSSRPVDRPARSITVTRFSVCIAGFETHSGLRKPDYWHQQEVQATRKDNATGGEHQWSLQSGGNTPQELENRAEVELTSHYVGGLV